MTKEHKTWLQIYAAPLKEVLVAYAKENIET